MKPARFEWDDAKAAANWRRHGVSLEHAATAVGDTFAVEWIDNRLDYGEERLNFFGMCQRTLLYVAFTERSERTRIISARRALRHEQDRYFQEGFR